MSKEPKRCDSCEGKGIYVWTDRSGMARGVTCSDCKGTGKVPSVTPLPDSPPPIPSYP